MGTVSIDPEGVSDAAARLQAAARRVASRDADPGLPAGLTGGVDAALRSLFAAEARATTATATDIGRLAARSRAAVVRAVAADRSS